MKWGVCKMGCDMWIVGIGVMREDVWIVASAGLSAGDRGVGVFGQPPQLLSLMPRSTLLESH